LIDYKAARESDLLAYVAKAADGKLMLHLAPASVTVVRLE
jgi:hypothetical protein